MTADGSDPGLQAPAWTKGATQRQALLRGARRAFGSLPAFVVFATAIGFGALARDAGFDLWQTLFIAATIFALPGQVVLVQQAAAGATLLAAALAVMLTSVRFLPMTVALLPWLRDGSRQRTKEYLLSHFMAITVWLESRRWLPVLPPNLRMPFFAGFALMIYVGNTSAAVIGYVVAANVPTPLAAGLVFLTPLYFGMSLILTAVQWPFAVAIAVGAIVGPVAFVYAPGFDLALSGLVGGTVAYGLKRWREGR
ncbi:MAG: AzlC family ABC transporter permease [Hyphomicrobiales bacterium]